MIHFFYDSCLMFFQFLIPGIFLGFVYDIFRIIRIGRNDKAYRVGEEIRKRYFPKKAERKSVSVNTLNREAILVFFEDIFFFLIAAITEILAVYYFNDGEIRIYGLLFSGIGFLCYQKTIGRLLICISKKILYLFRKTFYFCICLILTPAFFIVRKIKPKHTKINE